MGSCVHPVASAAALALILQFGASGAGAVSLEEVRHEVHPAVEALPVIARSGRADQTRLVVRGRLGRAGAKKVIRRALAVRRHVLRRFSAGGDRSGKRPIQVCLFATTRAYEAFVERVFGPDTFQDDVGFFSPYHRLVAVDLSRKLDALSHELTHALLADEPGRLPYWVDEGLASLYVGAEHAKKGLRFSARHRLADLRAARKAGRLPGFAELTESDDRQVYGPEWRDYYSLGRFLLLYLDRRGKLDGFVEALRADQATPARQQALIEGLVKPKAFWAWVEGLRP